MANDRLRAAIGRARTSVEEVARRAEVDPKTVHRWIAGRTPHPRHRWTVAKFLHEDEEFLWPGVSHQTAEGASGEAEIVAAYPYRSDFPVAQWWNKFNGAKKQIDLLGYTLYFLPLQHPTLIQLLRDKCDQGCEIRAVIAHPSSERVADREREENIAGMTLTARIQMSLHYLDSLLDCHKFELRYQDAPLYNSIFRFDSEMLVTPHLYATVGAAAPLLHLKRLNPEGIFSRFEQHFEAIWTSPTTSAMNEAEHQAIPMP